MNVARILNWLATPYSLYLLFRNPQISWKVKLRAGIILLVALFYIINPFDIIPDLTPLGLIDDLVVLPLGITLAEKALKPGVSVGGIIDKAQGDIKKILIWIAVAILALLTLIASGIGLVIFLIIRN